MLEILKAELERLLDLNQLKSLCDTVLGAAPSRPVAVETPAAWAAAIVDECAERDAIEALSDVLVASRAGVDPRVKELRTAGFVRPEPPRIGSTLGPYTIEECLGSGRLGTVYAARQGDQRVRLKLLRDGSERARAALARYFATTRLVSSIGHPGLPAKAWAGVIDGRYVIAHELPDGLPLDRALGQRSPVKLREAWPVVRRILEALGALHARGIAHGALVPGNILVAEREAQLDVVLVDAGSSYVHRSLEHGLWSAPAPEQLRGELPTARSDLYAFGVLLYELLGGRSCFSDAGPARALAQLERDPEPLSFVAPRGWVTDELDALVLALLDRDPANRPPDAEAVLDVLETPAAHSQRLGDGFSEEELERSLAALLERPSDSVAAAVLEASIDQGADPRRVAEAFALAADELKDEDGRGARRRLLTRSAELRETLAGDPAAAAGTYRKLLEADRDDEATWTALDRVYRRLGRYETLVELMLERLDHTKDPAQRARTFAAMGTVFSTKLADREQALVAFTHALCEEPNEDAYVAELEQLAGTNTREYVEVLATMAQTASTLEPDRRNALLARMGAWYRGRAARPDLAVECFQAILSTDPANDPALSEMAILYRRAQHWRELSAVLLKRSDLSATPAGRRELEADAAEVLERELGDREAAANLYAKILDDDPGHERAGEALARLYQRLGRAEDHLRVLERRASGLFGEKRQSVLCQLAEALERAGDLERASDTYEEVLRQAPQQLDALRGLERTYQASERFAELHTVLERELELALSPSQKVSLLERIAALNLSQFLDRERASYALERIIELDPAHEHALATLAEHYEAAARWADYARVLELQARRQSGASRARVLITLGRVLEQRLHEPERAIEAYEEVLALEPEEPHSLAALAALRAELGDAQRAVEALDALAAGATHSEERAELHVRAGDLLDAQGKPLDAADRYQRALEAVPLHREAGRRLRRLRLRLELVDTVVQMLQRDIARADSPALQAELSAELAHVLHERAKDSARAAAAAGYALERDPANVQAHVILGDIARASAEPAEALRHYEHVRSHFEHVGGVDAGRVLSAHAACLAATGATSEALALSEKLRHAHPDDLEVWYEGARLAFSHDAPAAAAHLCEETLARFEARLKPAARAELAYWIGEGLRRSGELDRAFQLLRKAALDEPSSPLPLKALAELHEQRGEWPKLVQTLQRLLELVSGPERQQVLIRLGDLAAATLHEPDAAAQHYLSALAEQPDDRKVLVKLLQLYSDERQWARLVEVISTLAEMVPEPSERVKYLTAAANVAANELGDEALALELTERALADEPGAEPLFRRALELRAKAGDTPGVRQLLEQHIELAAAANDRDRAARLAAELADLHLSELAVGDAIAVNEAVLRLNPGDLAREQVLCELYASDPTRYLDRAVALHRGAIARDPFDPEPYHAMRKLYVDIRRRDAVWCVCQALAALHRAEPEEQAYFERHRTGMLIPREARVTDDDWYTLIMHPDVDPHVTRILEHIQPTILAARAHALEELGYAEGEAIDAEEHPSVLVRALSHAAQSLSMRTPLLFSDPRGTRALSLAHSQRHCLLVSQAALEADLPVRRAAFVAAAHLAYFRSPFYVRMIIPSIASLKAWVLGAIRLVIPRLPVSDELAAAVAEAQDALERRLNPVIRDRLAQPVAKLMQDSGQANVSRWIAGVDLTADRVGFIVCDDLENALAVIRASGDAGASVSAAERTRQLFSYAVSSDYLRLRERLRVSVDIRDMEEELLLELEDSAPPASRSVPSLRRTAGEG